MEKKYKEIEFRPGCSLESAIKKLKEQNDLACGSFNGQMLYSDVDDINSAFKKVKGKTKAEFDEAKEKRQREYEAKDKEHKKEIPRLTKEWIEKGKVILDEKYHELWSKMVPIRLGDIYNGMELGASLDIVKELNNGCQLEVAKGIIEKQGHSGMSLMLVRSMIKELCDRGIEFVNYTKI